MLCIASIMLTPMIMITLAGGSDAYLSWAVFAALVISGVTTAIPLRFSGAMRLWAPAIGIVAGCLVAGLGFGIYDLTTVAEATWIGLPDLAYPGIDLSFRPEFRALLPSFIMAPDRRDVARGRRLPVEVRGSQALGRGDGNAAARGGRRDDADPDARRGGATADRERRLLQIAHSDGKAADLAFIATTDATNLEDQLAMLSEGATSVPVESETPLRLLRHYASSIRHEQYHDIDILMIRVEAVGRAGQVGWD